MLFYNDHSANVYYHMNHYRRLCSVFMEPSYCACYLCAVFMYFSNKKFTTKNIVLLVFIALEVLLGFSTTGYIALVISTLIFLIGRFNSKTGKYLLTCGLFALIFLLIFFNDTLNQVIFDKMSSGSANTRYYWNRNALRAFQSSKFFGVGYKNVRASTIFYSLLGELGLFGLIFYLALNLSILLFIFKNRNHKYHNVLGIGLGIVSICICQTIACPDLDLCVYWLFMFLFAISNNLSLNSEMSSIALVEESVQLENSYMTGNLN